MYRPQFRIAILALVLAPALIVTEAAIGSWSSSALAQCACGAPRPPAAARTVRVNPGMPAQSGHANRGPVRPPGIDAGARAARDAASGVRRQAANRTGPNNTPAAEDGADWESFGEAVGAVVEDGQDEGAVWISFGDPDGDDGSDDAEREGYRNSWSRDEAMSEEEFDDAELPEFDLSQDTDAEFSDDDFSDVEFGDLEEAFDGPDPELIAQLERELNEAILFAEIREGELRSKVLGQRVRIAEAELLVFRGATVVAITLAGGWAFEAALEGSYGVWVLVQTTKVAATQFRTAYWDSSKKRGKHAANLQAWATTESIGLAVEAVGTAVVGPLVGKVAGMLVEAGMEVADTDGKLAASFQREFYTSKRSAGPRSVK